MQGKYTIYALQSGREFSCTPREIEVFAGIILYMGLKEEKETED